LPWRDRSVEPQQLRVSSELSPARGGVEDKATPLEVEQPERAGDIGGQVSFSRSKLVVHLVGPVAGERELAGDVDLVAAS
jgi:hypothetical protein